MIALTAPDAAARCVGRALLVLLVKVERALEQVLTFADGVARGIEGTAVMSRRVLVRVRDRVVVGLVGAGETAEQLSARFDHRGAGLVALLRAVAGGETSAHS